MICPNRMRHVRRDHLPDITDQPSIDRKFPSGKRFNKPGNPLENQRESIGDGLSLQMYILVFHLKRPLVWRDTSEAGSTNV